MPRFVLLYHECPSGYEKPSHWDFMLEVGEVLWTWELRELPAEWQSSLADVVISQNSMVTARRLADHRLAYLEYEGPLTNDRGHVTRIAGGEYTFLENTVQQIIASMTGDLKTTIKLAETIDSGHWTLTVLN